MENLNNKISNMDNTDVAIHSTIEMLKDKFYSVTGVELKETEVNYIKAHLQNIAKAKKTDVLNQINNLK